MILEVDIGNSSIKWRLRNGVELLLSGRYEHDGSPDYTCVFASLESRPEKVFVVSVIRKEQKRLSAWSVSNWHQEPVFASVSQCCAGVSNAYKDVSQMGPDRWVAMVAAFNLYSRPCLVVDSGSATTVDLLLASGAHLGGYIVPGFHLMREALFRDTDRVKLAAIDYDEPPIAGRSTEAAVASGLQLMQLGLVDTALFELLAAGAHQPVVVLTGGGGERLANLLQEHLSRQSRLACIDRIVVEQDLVFKGLPFVCA